MQRLPWPNLSSGSNTFFYQQHIDFYADGARPFDLGGKKASLYAIAKSLMDLATSRLLD